MRATADLRLAQAAASAGDRVTLAARPEGVLHVYFGPLTPGGGAIPRRRRPVCRAATRRLYVVPVELPPVGLADVGSGRRLCRRCSTHLEKAREGLRGPERSGAPAPVTREQHAAAYADLTEPDLWLSYAMAATDAEIDRCRWLAALLFDRLLPEPQPFPDGRVFTRETWLNAVARVKHEYIPPDQAAS